MLGLDYDQVLAPTSGSSDAAIDAAPPPTGSLRAEPVPAAQKPQSPPVIKILLPVVMVVAVGAVMVLSLIHI